jgi:hypothetical protein
VVKFGRVAPPWGPGARALRISVALGHPRIIAKTPAVQFCIEITRETTVSSKLIHCSIVDAISPLHARKKAAMLLNLYAARGANSARVLNPKNEVIFRL